MNTPRLPPLPHWCEEESPFAQQMQAYALAAIRAQQPLDKMVFCTYPKCQTTGMRCAGPCSQANGYGQGVPDSVLDALDNFEKKRAAHESTVYFYSLTSKKG